VADPIILDKEAAPHMLTGQILNSDNKSDTKEKSGGGWNKPGKGLILMVPRYQSVTRFQFSDVHPHVMYKKHGADDATNTEHNAYAN